MVNQQIVDDELSFANCLETIRKNRVMVSVIFVFWSFVSLLGYFRSPISFEAKSVVRIGSFKSPVMTIPYARQFIQEDKILNAAIKTGNLNLEISALKDKLNSGAIKIESVPETNYLKLTVRSGDYETARNICLAMAGVFVSEGNKIYEKRKVFIGTQINEINKRFGSRYGVVIAQYACNAMLSLNEELNSAEPFEVTDYPSANGEAKKEMGLKKLILQLMLGFVVAVGIVFLRIFIKDSMNKHNSK